MTDTKIWRKGLMKAEKTEGMWCIELEIPGECEPEPPDFIDDTVFIERHFLCDVLSGVGVDFNDDPLAEVTDGVSAMAYVWQMCDPCFEFKTPPEIDD